MDVDNDLIEVLGLPRGDFCSIWPWTSGLKYLVDDSECALGCQMFLRSGIGWFHQNASNALKWRSLLNMLYFTAQSYAHYVSLLKATWSACSTEKSLFWMPFLSRATWVYYRAGEGAMRVCDYQPWCECWFVRRGWMTFIKHCLSLFHIM